MTLTPPFPPNNGLVARTWLGTRVPGLVAAQVAMSLPALPSWADEGFVTVTTIPGTQPNVDVPVRKPLFQVDAWGATPDSAKPHWGKAWRLAELIRLATEEGQAYGQPLDLGPNYDDVRVQAAYLITEPNEAPGDPSGYARVTLDLALDWVPA